MNVTPATAAAVGMVCWCLVVRVLQFVVVFYTILGPLLTLLIRKLTMVYWFWH